MKHQMEMDNYMQAAATPNSKRFVVEDSITKVTSDGEPHGMMTMVAGLSGLLAAIIILAVVVFMVVCRKRKTSDKNQQSKDVAMTNDEKPHPKLSGNLNTAFVESTLSLSVDNKNNMNKDKNKENPWPTTIIIERN